MLVFPDQYTKQYTVLLLTPKGHKNYLSNMAGFLEDSLFHVLLFTVYLILHDVSCISPAIFVTFDLDELYIFHHLS